MYSRKSSTEGRMLLRQLRKIRRIILESLQKDGEATPRDLESIKRLVGVLESCDSLPEDIEIAKSLLKSLGESRRISVDLAMGLEDAVTQCERELMAFTSDASSLGAEVVDRLVPVKRALLMELDEVSADTQEPRDEGLFDLIKGHIFDMPGMYLKEIQEALVSRYSRDASYTTVRRYVGELEREQEVLTIGGPQGSYRYCFPNPHRITDREEYYGGPFAISGEIEERLTLKWTQRSPKGKFRDLYIVNSTNRPRTLLIVDLAHKEIPQLTPGSSIVSLGKLEDIDYVLSHERIEPPNGADGIDDVLVGLKVDMRVDGEAMTVWFDEEMLGRRSFYT